MNCSLFFKNLITTGSGIVKIIYAEYCETVSGDASRQILQLPLTPNRPDPSPPQARVLINTSPSPIVGFNNFTRPYACCSQRLHFSGMFDSVTPICESPPYRPPLQSTNFTGQSLLRTARRLSLCLSLPHCLYNFHNQHTLLIDLFLGLSFWYTSSISPISPLPH